MRIAQVAPLAESVPPKLYGGTERVVSYLTEELVRLGHDVTLFASSDSETSAKLVACTRRALRLDYAIRDPLAPVTLMLEQVRRRAHEFDMLHFHLEHQHFPLFRPLARKTVSTVHGRVDLAELAPLYREFSDMPLVSISQAQRAPLPFANWVGTVHHGLPAEVCPFNPAFNQSARSGYYAFLGNATALLFPIDWPEPFGLAMIEAMSCGTPVIAWPHGSVRELVEDGRTGFIVDSIDAAVGALERAPRLN